MLRRSVCKKGRPPGYTMNRNRTLSVAEECYDWWWSSSCLSCLSRTCRMLSPLMDLSASEFAEDEVVVVPSRLSRSLIGRNRHETDEIEALSDSLFSGIRSLRRSNPSTITVRPLRPWCWFWLLALGVVSSRVVTFTCSDFNFLVACSRSTLARFVAPLTAFTPRTKFRVEPVKCEDDKREIYIGSVKKRKGKKRKQQCYADVNVSLLALSCSKVGCTAYFSVGGLYGNVMFVRSQIYLGGREP